MTKPVWHYVIDSEGRLWHDGFEFDDPETLRFFMEKMEPLPDGAARVVCQGETCLLHAEDVPYVVQDVVFSKDKIALIFPGGYQEVLDPETLEVGKLNVLYCRVRRGAFQARFNRRSYLEVARKIEFDSKAKSYYLTIDGRRFTIRGVA